MPYNNNGGSYVTLVIAGGYYRILVFKKINKLIRNIIWIEKVINIRSGAARMRTGKHKDYNGCSCKDCSPTKFLIPRAMFFCHYSLQ